MNPVESLPHPRILVLSGGGGNGAAQAFAVRELYRRGYVPDLIIGTSIGAWNGAYLATHPGPLGAETLCDLWLHGAFFQMARPRGVQLVRAALLRGPSLIGTASIERALDRTGLGRARWSDVSVPFVVGAIDAVRLHLEYWDRDGATGPLGPYVAASSALAPLLPFGQIDGRQWVDAGMQDNYGIPEVVRRLAADGRTGASILVLDCAPAAPQAAAENVARAADVALGATFRRHRDDGVALAKAAGHAIDVIEVGGNHAISDYMDPADGEVVGREAIHAWALGSPYYAAWPQPSFLRRVSNVVSFCVGDVMARWGVRPTSASVPTGLGAGPTRLVTTVTNFVGLTNGHGTRRRSLGQAMRQWPGDWLFERSRVPADLISILAFGGTAIARIGAGNVFALTLVASKIPFAANLVRAAWHRDITYWTRPQAHQPTNIIEEPLPPMESDPDAKGVPHWLRWVVATAEKGNRLAGFFDDWLNQRSRVPAFIIEASVLVFGIFVAPIPWVALFPINAVVTAVPSILGAYLGFRNHDFQRWSRGGMRQRDGLVPAPRRGNDEVTVTGRAVALRQVTETGDAAPAPAPVVATIPIPGLPTALARVYRAKRLPIAGRVATAQSRIPATAVVPARRPAGIGDISL